MSASVPSWYGYKSRKRKAADQRSLPAEERGRALERVLRNHLPRPCLALFDSKARSLPFLDARLFVSSVMATPRLRHRPQTEDEDAAALKLGAGQ